ncbi:hypothetical protein MLD38_011277 [Melastoma candidum]|uniref:Uncharacterized protein n=1 Tax=Melastoma candidum TaxID=119954 RepID=A0ACB9R5K5_9MYRT|nr:hypothetical protein MLD38_011277 [Melastoma candidum]
MSSSSVSLTANPTVVARRKPVLLPDVKIPSSTAATDVPLATAAATTSSKDVGLSPSRNNDPAVQEALGDTADARRVRKLPPKKERPWWVNAMGGFAKNFVLLTVVVGLAQLVLKLAVKSAVTPPELMDFEGRIAEVEGLVKKTVNSLQVQMDVVDERVGSKVLGLRKEVKEARESGEKLGSEVRVLAEKSRFLERGLKELRDGDWLSREELQGFVDEVRAAKKRNGDARSDVSFDELRAYAREMLIKQIARHVADGIGMVDYAVASGGGSVVGHSEAYSAGNGWLALINRQGVHADAIKMLKPSFGEPGQCFPLKGRSGFVVVKLRTSIVPEAVTLEHVAKV